MSSQERRPRRPTSDEILYVDRQTLAIHDFDCAPGLILDIGGGGEGIIGKVKGDRVISIDTLRSELAEVANEALKIVMDARAMSFLDGSFRTAAAFFSLMYISQADQATVFAETHRVLKPGGEFLLWDVAMPDVSECGKRYFMIPLTFELPGGRSVRTGYGVPAKRQSLEGFAAMGAHAGFEVIEQVTQPPYVVFLRLRRP